MLVTDTPGWCSFPGCVMPSVAARGAFLIAFPKLSYVDSVTVSLENQTEMSLMVLASSSVSESCKKTNELPSYLEFSWEVAFVHCDSIEDNKVWCCTTCADYKTNPLRDIDVTESMYVVVDITGVNGVEICV